jgi:dephospho-CoA kinase
MDAREKAQLPLSVKEAQADAIIHNGGAQADTKSQVDHLVKSWVL